MPIKMMIKEVKNLDEFRMIPEEERNPLPSSEHRYLMNGEIIRRNCMQNFRWQLDQIDSVRERTTKLIIAVALEGVAIVGLAVYLFG